jgi:hypothetical protein
MLFSTARDAMTRAGPTPLSQSGRFGSRGSTGLFSPRQTRTVTNEVFLPKRKSATDANAASCSTNRFAVLLFESAYLPNGVACPTQYGYRHSRKPN